MLPIAILAGGLATRLRPITETIPKALIEIAGEPFLAHQLRLLRRAGYERAVLCAGHLGGMIREFAGDGRAYGVSLEYSFDGPRLLGTAGAIVRALPLLGERFSVIYGDSYLPCDYAAAEAAFAASGKPALMTVYCNEGRWHSSNVEFDGARVVRYDKSNRTLAMRHIDYGLGSFRRDAFESVPADQPCDLADLYQDLVRRGELAAWESPDRFYEIGSREGIAGLTEYLSR
ncbi:MAG: NTP transferase domain-containing protein [Acidobacteriota bacterium]|nr:NTP transferase domain-containing protein [Acidobacteriota bacterium]